MEQEPSTREKILAAGLDEFQSKGFLAASLRNIVKATGVTTGAFYGYFSSKEALFAALVEPHAAAVMGRFMEAHSEFADLPEARQPEHVGQESSDCVMWMVDYVYQNFDAFKLLICHAQGTAYEHFVHRIVEIEVEATERYMEVLRRLGRPVPKLDPQLCHIIASGLFNGIFEIVVHDMPYERARRNVQQLQEFYLAGWQKMMGD